MTNTVAALLLLTNIQMSVEQEWYRDGSIDRLHWVTNLYLEEIVTTTNRIGIKRIIGPQVTQLTNAPVQRPATGTPPPLPPTRL
jgi:hypothetical protein